jgi:malic enzyme
MFGVAATTLADLVSADRLKEGALYPQISELRQISRAIAIAVAREALASGASPLEPDHDMEAAVDAAMWMPAYQDLSYQP